jgi:hypothetical protein
VNRIADVKAIGKPGRGGFGARHKGGNGVFMWQKAIRWMARRLRSRYVRLLEEEVARLRAENRALTNSLLGTAGFPPIVAEHEARPGTAALSPVRRRTWTQIARERELAAGRNAAGKEN